MSIRVMSDVWGWSVSPTAKLVALALADHADDRGRAWPGLEGVAAKTGLHETTVRSAVRTLADAGLIRITGRADDHGRQTSNLYTFVAQEGGGSRSATPPQRLPKGRGSQSATPEGRPGRPESSKDPSKEPAARVRGSDGRARGEELSEEERPTPEVREYATSVIRGIQARLRHSGGSTNTDTESQRLNRPTATVTPTGANENALCGRSKFEGQGAAKAPPRKTATTKKFGSESEDLDCTAEAGGERQ